MIAAMLKVVDYLIALVKAHQQVNRDLYVNFIQPAFEAFEAVHRDYIDSLVRYSSVLADKTLKMDWNHPVFADLEMDALKTDSLRTKLKDLKPKESSAEIRDFLTAISFYLRGVAALGDHAELITKLVAPAGGHGMFQLDSLAVGTDHPIDVLPSSPYIPLVSDPWRLALRETLMRFDAPPPETDEEDYKQLTEAARDLMFLGDDRRRELCLNAIKNTMGQFQALYAVISAANAKLRADLLTAR
jgi:hypothetical protein